jgi:hypothetical protein
MSLASTNPNCSWHYPLTLLPYIDSSANANNLNSSRIYPSSGASSLEPSKVVFKRFCNDSLNYCSRINKKVFASIFITLTDFTPASSLKSLVGAEPGLSKSGRLVFSS